MQGVAFGENDPALHDVLQFADVAGPVIAVEHIDDRTGEAAHIFAADFAVFFEKKVGELEDVTLALAQRGDVDGEDVQAVKQVFSEAAFGGHLLQVAVGGGDDADVDFGGVRAADAFEFALLQHAQKFDLNGRRNLADLVEKQRAAVGQFEAALAVGGGAGERAFHVAEEFAFNEIFGQRGAVGLDKGLVGAVAVVVDGVGDEFLAGAGFAADEHAGLAFGDLGDLVVHNLHLVGVADDVGGAEAVFQLGAEALIFGFQFFAALLGAAAEADGLREQRGDDLHDVHVGFEIHGLIVGPVGTERPDGGFAGFDRHADEAGFLPGGGALGAVEEQRRLAGAAHQNRIAAFDHLSGDAFAQFVASAPGLLRCEAVRRIDENVVGLAVEQGDGGVFHAQVARHGVHDGVHDFAHVEAAFEDLGDLFDEFEIVVTAGGIAGGAHGTGGG